MRMTRTPTPSSAATTRLRLVSQAIDCGMLYGPARDNQFEFKTPAEVVADRKRLGVRGGFIRSLTADSLSMLDAAREIETFCHSKVARGAFFPAYTLHPTELFSEGATEAFAALLQKNTPYILRLFVNGREDYFQLCLRFLSTHMGDRPIIAMLPVSEIPSLTMLITEARKHPQIRFVLTEHMWNGDSKVHAAMAETENIWTDTSLGHTADNVESFVSRYGAGRVVLSLGFRAVGGASLASVLGAGISDEEKEAILFGNVTKLLGIPWCEEDVPPAASLPDGIWKSFLANGRPDLPVIDCHGHFGPVAAWPVHEQQEAVQIPRKCAEMEGQNLRYFIFSHSRALFADPAEGNVIAEKQVIEANDPRILSYFVYNPRYAASLAPYIDRVPRSKIFIGFKILCDYWRVPMNSPGFDPMWEIADRHQLPILIHTWEGPYNSPAMIDPIAERYPNARFILAHCGGTDDGRKEAEEVAKKHRNVSLEWCGSFLTHKPWEDTIREIGSHKLLFGTDAVYHSHEWELARLLSVPLEPEAFRRILHDNMMAIITPLLTSRDLRSIF